MFRFHSLAGTNHAVSTRHGGLSPAPYESLNVGYGTPDREENVAGNRRLLLQQLGIDAHEVVSARLVHGNDVAVFERHRPENSPTRILPVRVGSARVEPFFASDGVVSDVPGLHFLLTCADCVPLLFHDPVRGVMGAAHAGWRGTAAGIALSVVRRLERVFGSHPADIRVGIGPSIGACCYTVGEDVPGTFSRHGAEPVLRRRGSLLHLDLWATNERQLRDCGVRAIEHAGVCTACNTHTFFSHRAEEGRTGRFAMIAGLPGA